jgi:hypothetical protein
MSVLRKSLTAAAFIAAVGALGGPAGAQVAGTSPLFAVLNGQSECNAAGTCRKGDLDAHGSATIIFPTGTSLCFAILVDNLAGATAAHIHRGRSTENGAVVVNLTAPAAPGAGNPGTTSGCVNGLSGALVAEIRRNPAGFYINVHNAAFPAGAVRGQLF